MTPEHAMRAFQVWFRGHPIHVLPRTAHVSSAMLDALESRVREDRPIPYVGRDGGLLVKGCQVFEDATLTGTEIRG